MAAKRPNDKNKNAEKKNQRRKMILIVGGGILVVAAIVLIVVLTGGTRKNNSRITEQILSYSGYSRTVEQDEYSFFETLARKSVTDISDESEIAQKTEEMIRSANAQFYLGNKLGICEPYSFERLQEQLILENAQRKVKKEQGEPIYGPVQYTLDGYFEYVDSNLQIDIISYLAEHADDSMLEKAKRYYEENKNDYDTPEEIKYTITENGATQEFTIPWSDIKSVQTSDYDLFDLLAEPQEGKEITYLLNETERTSKILSVTRRASDFEQQKRTIVEDFLGAGYYDELLQKVAENNPTNIVMK